MLHMLTHAHTHAHIHTCTHMLTYTLMLTRTPTTHPCSHTRAHMDTHMITHAHMLTHTHADTHACTRLHTLAHTRTLTHKAVHTQCVCVCMDAGPSAPALGGLWAEGLPPPPPLPHRVSHPHRGGCSCVSQVTLRCRAWLRRVRLHSGPDPGALPSCSGARPHGLSSCPLRPQVPHLSIRNNDDAAS